MKSFQRTILFFILGVSLIGATGCGSNLVAAFSATDTPLPPSATEAPSLTSAPTPTITPTPPPPSTPTITPTPAWVFQQGEIVCPILLYHRIEAVPPNTSELDARYYVSPEDFRQQMQALYEWGYTPIPISLLVEAISQGAELPPRPVVLTFDDGYMSVFKNAFPIMKEFGFVGVAYIVADRLHADGFMGPDQLQRLLRRGWEVGSHSMTHSDLTAKHDSLDTEVKESKRQLSKELGYTVRSFAYPFGKVDATIANAVASALYYDAVGLGTSYTNDLSSLYYLSRIEVRNGTDLTQFAALLPWSGPPAP